MSLLNQTLNASIMFNQDWIKNLLDLVYSNPKGSQSLKYL